MSRCPPPGNGTRLTRIVSAGVRRRCTRPPRGAKTAGAAAPLSSRYMIHSELRIGTLRNHAMTQQTPGTRNASTLEQPEQRVQPRGQRVVDDRVEHDRKTPTNASAAARNSGPSTNSAICTSSCRNTFELRTGSISSTSRSTSGGCRDRPCSARSRRREVRQRGHDRLRLLDDDHGRRLGGRRHVGGGLPHVMQNLSPAWRPQSRRPQVADTSAALVAARHCAACPVYFASSAEALCRA